MNGLPDDGWQGNGNINDYRRTRRSGDRGTPHQDKSASRQLSDMNGLTVSAQVEVGECAYCALARTFGKREIDPVGSLSGFIGVLAGAFGGKGDDPAPDVSGTGFPA